MKKTGLIFDVDGTLCDSMEVMLKAWIVAIDEIGKPHIPITAEFIAGYMGKTMDEWALGVFPTLPLEESRSYIATCSQAENDWIREYGTAMYPKVREVFETLSKTYELYILSNCGKGYIEAIMESAKLTPFVKDHLCFGDNGLDKPENLKKLIQEHQLEEAFYIGDTDRDEACCEEAGVPFIFASYGFGQAKHPKWTITEMEDLLHLSFTDVR